MALKPLDKNWGNDKKSISFVGKDFTTLKQNLIEFTKTYFPNTYSDFNEDSPGIVFIEQAAAIGDMLSFYQDTQLKESMLSYATERKNIVALAQSMGYKPKITTPAVTTLNVYQLTLAKNDATYSPDESYYLKVREGMEIESSTDSTIIFRTIDSVDFSNPTDREIDVFERDNTGIPTKYLITKKVKAISATEKTISIQFDDDTDYPSKTLNDTNIISIVSVTDGDGGKWYEVPYLAQESIFVEQPNTVSNGGELNNSASVVPYILEVQKVPKRFSVKVNSDNTMDLQFGTGNNTNDDTLLPNTKNIGLGLANSVNRLNQGIDPSNFLKTNTFGIVPVNDTLTVTYLVGGGITSNINTGDLTRIRKIDFEEDLLSINIANISTYNQLKNSIAVENIEPATGG